MRLGLRVSKKRTTQGPSTAVILLVPPPIRKPSLIPLNRHGPGILLRKIRRWFEPDLDPRRVDAVFDEFDRARGYDAWHRHCRAQLARAVPLDADDQTLATRGFVPLPVMTPTRAAELLVLAGEDEGIARLKRDSAKLEGYALDDPIVVRQLLEAALTEPVDRHCLAFFGSEYLVHWTTLSRTSPSREPASVSFRWHCDKGPRAHLKLLVYLNDHSEHGGGTSYLDLAGTAAVARTGYVFARGKRRIDSLAQLGAMAGRALEAHDHRPHAGDAVLFQPSRVLHSGITPTLGPRYVLTLCLLPSPVPWREAFERGAQVDLRRDDLWHADAREIERRLAGAVA